MDQVRLKDYIFAQEQDREGAYGLRAAFIHHGHQIDTDEMERLQEFLLTAWLSFNILIEAAGTYTTKEQLFDQLEEWKMT